MFCVICSLLILVVNILWRLQTTQSIRKKIKKYITLPTVRADRLHKTGGGLITLIRDNITFTTTDIPSTINTHNTELQMVKVHINNTKHITIANIYIPPRDSTSTNQLIRRYKTANNTSQTYHTQSSPELLTTRELTGHNLRKTTESTLAQTTIPTNKHTANI